MGITYNNEKNSNRDIEPIFTRNRVKYRSYRSSELENSEMNNFRIDTARIVARIEKTESNLDERLKYFNGDPSDRTELVNLDDGLSYGVDGVYFVLDGDVPVLENLKIDTTNKISSRIFRLINKISRLEKE